MIAYDAIKVQELFGGGREFRTVEASGMRRVGRAITHGEHQTSYRFICFYVQRVIILLTNR